jgi:hypothetical protein
MREKNVVEDPEQLSPLDIRSWLMQEIRDVTKASELRLREANEFTTSYLLGEISAEEATERLWKYQNRWGEALAGTFATKGKSDEEILQSMDEARGGHATLQKTRQLFKQRFGNDNSGKLR